VSNAATRLIALLTSTRRARTITPIVRQISYEPDGRSEPTDARSAALRALSDSGLSRKSAGSIATNRAWPRTVYRGAGASKRVPEIRKSRHWEEKSGTQRVEARLICVPLQNSH
jgi:hypothetical protein